MKDKKDGEEKTRLKLRIWPIVLWIVVFGVIGLLFSRERCQKEGREELIYSQFITAVEEGKVDSVLIKPREKTWTILGSFSDSSKTTRFFRTVVSGNDQNLIPLLKKYNVVYEIKDSGCGGFGSFTYFLPLVIFFVLIMLMMRETSRNIKGQQDRMGQWNRSKHRQIGSAERPKERFKDVAGVDEAKAEVVEVIDFMKKPERFTRLGAKVPKGIILMGPTGCGKTLLARAVAGEAGVPFFATSGSEFVELFVGVGAGRVRDLFENAKKYAPSIIFIDELDAIGRQRGTGIGGGHDEREQTLNQILVRMDGFEADEGVIVIGATNRPDILDPALLRPGRFDRQVYVPQPDLKGREAILKVHLEKVPLAKGVDLKKITRATPGFSGAHLASLVNEAAILAARRGDKAVTIEDFEKAKDRVIMGAERKILMNPEEKKKTAYHEAGHAILAEVLEEADPLNKVSIISRGRALGVTQQLPIEDRYLPDKAYLKARLVVLLGGRVAEEIVYSPEHVSAGAQNDLESATQIIESMVCELGMSEKLGLMIFGKKQGEVFLGEELAERTRDYSEEIAQLIDEEKKRLTDEAKKKAEEILTANRKELDRLAEALLEKETLGVKEVRKIIGKNIK